MEIKGKVHCFFEQSGTFKNEFKKLGYQAFDYDIQNNFGQTDHVLDLFAEIDKAYNGAKSVFNKVTKYDLIEDRSMILSDYARNFICDFIIGKKQDIGQLSLF